MTTTEETQYDFTEFEPAELEEFQERLRRGEVLETSHMGGCHTYVREENNNYLTTLVTYDGIHFTMGIGPHYGCRRIDQTSPEEIVEWYNTVYNQQKTFVRYRVDHDRTVFVK